MPVRYVSKLRKQLQSPPFTSSSESSFARSAREAFVDADVAAQQLVALDTNINKTKGDPAFVDPAIAKRREISNRLMVVATALDLLRSETPTGSQLRPRLALLAAQAVRASDSYEEQAQTMETFLAAGGRLTMNDGVPQRIEA